MTRKKKKRIYFNKLRTEVLYMWIFFKGRNNCVRHLAAFLMTAAFLEVLMPETTPFYMAYASEKQEEPALTAGSAVLMDGETGRILYEKAGKEIRPMASTTKIMTCILALENCSPDETVEISEYAASMPDVQLNIRKGEIYRLEDLLYSMMLESHNDSAAAIAEHTAGTVEAFADMMNQKARDIGCTDTHFITPNGLDAAVEETGEMHSTTAEDLAAILRYCILQSPEKEQFLKITRTPSHTFTDLSGKRSFSCINHNALLTSMEGAVSGKTGFTNGAGYCYVGAVDRDGRMFIAALLGCGWPPHKNYKWQDMQKLISYGESAYSYREIKKQELTFLPVPVENGILDSAELEVVYPDDSALRVLMKEGEEVKVIKKTVRKLTAPVHEGQNAGQVDYYVGGTRMASYPVRVKQNVGEWNLEFCVKTLLNCFAF